MTYAEYVAREAASVIKHEYVRGEVFVLGAKAAHYRRIPSLREYVLVSQDEPLIEVFRRTDTGSWELIEARAGSRIELRSLGVTIDVDAIYADPLA